MKHKDYQQVGRFPKFFLAKDQRPVTNIDNPKLKYWPGYELTSKATRSGIFLNIDSCTKFIMQDTILEQYIMYLDEGKRAEDFFRSFDSSDPDQPRVTVLLSHNSRIEQVDGMTADYNPETYTFKNDMTNEDISMSQYFHDKYKINLNAK